MCYSYPHTLSVHLFCSDIYADDEEDEEEDSDEEGEEEDNSLVSICLEVLQR